MAESSNRSLLVSKGWIQAVALVMLFGFFIMGLLAYYTYTDEPPIPAKGNLMLWNWTTPSPREKGNL